MAKFYARNGYMQPLPNQSPSKPRRYYGRKSVPATNEKGEQYMKHEPLQEPFEIDENSDAGKALIALCRLEMPVLPADEATAKLVGISNFQKPERASDGEWDFPVAKEKPAKG
jgi:hypothetical protein